MATFLPGVTDNALRTPTLDLDYSFLQANQQKKDTQYIQGLSEVSAGYNAILNAKVTDYANVQKKQEYAKVAEDGLKKLSRADLSLPANVAQAETLYSPFWQDDILLQDIGYTKKFQINEQKALSVLNSKDKEIQKTYDPRYLELLKYQKLRLQQADRNPDEYRDIEIDDWTPFYKVDQHLSDMREKDKFAITHDIIDNNGHTLTVTNGPTSVPGFRTYADGNIGTEYEAQYNILGKLDRERMVYQYKQIYPQATRKEALEQVTMGGDYSLYNRVVDSYKSRLDDHTHMIATTEAELKAINDLVVTQKDKQPTELQAYNIQRLSGQLNVLKSSEQGLKKSYSDLLSEDGRYNMINHPEYALGQIHRTSDIDKWAQGQAENATYKISKDDAFWANETLRREYAQLGEQSRHNQIEELQGNKRIKIESFNAETGRINALANQAAVQAKYPWLTGNNPNALGGRSGGAATDQLFHINPVDEANLKVAQIASDIYNRAYSPGGLPSVFSELPESIATSDDVLRFSKYMNDYYNQVENKDKGNIEAYNKIAAFIGKETGLPVTNPEEVNKAFMAYIPKYLNNHTKNGALNTTESKQISDIYNGMKTDMNTLEKDAAERRNLINKELSDNPKEYQNITVNGRLINERDISNTLAESGLESVTVKDENGITRIIPLNEIAQEYLRGGNIIDSRHNLSINGVSYPIMSVKANGEEKKYPDHWYQSENARAQEAGNEVFSYLYGRNKYGEMSSEPMHSVMSKYGKPKDVANKIKTLNNKVVPNTSIYKNLNGVIGNSTLIPHDKEDHPGTLALREDVQPGQFNAMYDLDNNREVLSGKDQRAVQDIINDPKLINWIGQEHRYVDMSHTGKPGNIITFRSSVEGEDVPKDVPENIKPLLGKRIFIEQSSTHGATWNTQYPKAVDYSYHPLSTEGGRIVSTSIQDATNMGSYTITNSQGQLVVTGNITVKDPNTGQDTVRRIYYPTSLNNPEHTVQQVNNFWLQNGDNYRKAFDYHRMNHNK